MEEIVEIVEWDAHHDASAKRASGPMDGGAVYRLATDAKTRVRSLRLRPALWDCLLKVNGRRDAANIAAELERPLTDVLDDLDRLSLIGVVREPGAVSLQEHLYPRSTTTSKAKTSTEAPIAVEPTSTAGHEHPADTTVEENCIGPQPRSLQCLLRLIRTRHASSRHAELAIYRIFTAVPRSLFESAGIRSFLFIDDATVVTDPELLRALVAETRNQLGVDVCPELRRCLAA